MGLIVAGIGMKTYVSPGLFISEVCPHNDDVIYDSVGFHHDFIKITNSSPLPVNLKGYGLSEDSTQLGKFIFPDLILETGENILVWADEKTVLNGIYSDDDALFSGFRLSDHDFVYLTDPDGKVIDSLRLPQMKRNISYLRDHAGDRGIKGKPSDMDIEDVPVSDSIKPPVLSVASGYYREPFFLSMDGDGNTVYYTVDASSPYTTGFKYDSAVPIVDLSPLDNFYSNLGPVSLTEDPYIPAEPLSKATVIRAVSQGPDGTFSKETVAVYFVGEEVRNICKGSYTLSIVSDPQGLFSGKRGIYVTGNVWDMNKDSISGDDVDLHMVPANYNMRGSDWRRDASLTLFNENGECLYDEDGLISIRGAYGRSVIQKGFNLRSKKTGQKVFNGLFDNTGDIIALRTGSETDVYITNFRDSLNNRICENLNVPAQRSHCCQVYLDGEYWGCYNLQEHMDTTFVEGRYLVPSENVNLIRLNGEPEAVSELDEDLIQYNEVISYVNDHDLSNEEYYNEFCDMVDVDSLTDYYCVQLFFGNTDGYLFNNALWRSRKTGSGKYEDGKWRFLLFDLDNTDAYGSSDGAREAAVDPFVDLTWINEDQFYPALSKNRSFRQKLLSRMNELLSDDFSYETISPVIDEFESRYTAPMILSVKRFHDPGFTGEQYALNVQVVRDFFKERGYYISKYMKLHLED
ncbi:MAG: CotH kinase family protein [Lachnospiraceae bacterium]|nr:CotH kinase family protein [Lachnospiraceae bacterium]